MEKKTATFASYLTGFVLSIILTLAAYFAVQAHVKSEHSVISHEVLIPLILGLAVVQLLAQLFFFLHLGKESGPRWNLAVLISTLVLILIIIAGSLWIMNHLNYNMTPQEINKYLIDQSG
jgi:cytochrome o ubiquinol oxidase operon protein cyoD